MVIDACDVCGVVERRGEEMSAPGLIMEQAVVHQYSTCLLQTPDQTKLTNYSLNVGMTKPK